MIYVSTLSLWSVYLLKSLICPSLVSSHFFIKFAFTLGDDNDTMMETYCIVIRVCTVAGYVKAVNGYK